MPTIDLSPEEVAILRSALESAEYWEHRDDLPYNSGYILDPDMLDPDDYDIEELKTSEAWAEVLALRALDERLSLLEEDCRHINVDLAMDDFDPAKERLDAGRCADCGQEVRLEHDDDRVFWEVA